MRRWRFPLMFWHEFQLLLKPSFSDLTQGECSTPPLLRSSPFPRPHWPALNEELSWPTLVSSTWPGREAWTSATPAGWETGASAIPSTSAGPSAEEVFWGCELFTCTQTRLGTHFLSLGMMPSATQVGHRGTKEQIFWFNRFLIDRFNRFL